MVFHVHLFDEELNILEFNGSQTYPIKSIICGSIETSEITNKNNKQKYGWAQPQTHSVRRPTDRGIATNF